MKEKLLEIINNYGVNHQQRKLEEEVFELQEAIFDINNSGWEMDYHDYDELEKEYKNHIAEEIADCYVLLEQFRHYYNISDEAIKHSMEIKIDRQMERIKNDICQR